MARPPQTTRQSGGALESYEDAISDRYGFGTARGMDPTWAEIEEWARYDHLMRPMVAYSPDARQIWRGVWPEIEISIGTKKIAFSPKDIANRLTVRFSEPGGAQGDSTVYSSAASQALFGIRRPRDQRLNRAERGGQQPGADDSNYIAFLRSKQSSAAAPRAAIQYHAHVLGQIRVARLAADRQHEHDQHGKPAHKSPACSRATRL